MGDKLIAELTRELEERGWPQRELARRTKVSHTTIAKILNGERNPSVKLCQRMAEALGVPVDEIYQWTEIMPEKPEFPPQLDDWGRRLARLGDDQKAVALRAMEGVLRVAEDSAEYRVRQGKVRRE